MKLIELRLINFKGLKDFTFRPEGRDTNVYGDNGTGKTTIEDAFLWLLFGKNSKNQADFDIKTIDGNGRPVPGINHEVSGKLELETKTVELRRVFSEKWTKKRGSTERIFTGHTTDYYIDGVPCKEKEYKEYIDSIIDENTFRLLVDPFYFSETIPWQSRRQLLFKVCGEIQDEEVFESNKDLAELSGILNGRSIEDQKKVIMAKRREINQELDDIPIRIDEANRSLADIPSDQDVSKISLQIETLKSDTEKRQKERLALQQSGGISEKEKALAEVESRMVQHRLKYGEEIDKKLSSLRSDLRKIEADMEEIDRKHSGRQRVYDENDEMIDQTEEDMARLRVSWHKIDEEIFTYNSNQTCPNCGYDLMKESRESAEGDLNKNKSESLERIQAEGKAKKEKVDKLKAENEKLKKAISDLNSDKLVLDKQASALDEEIDALRATKEDYTKEDEYTRLIEKKTVLVAEIEQLRSGNNQEAIFAIDAEIKQINEEIAKLEETQAQIKQSEGIKGRIEELKKQEKTLAREYQKLEKELSLIDQFITTKCRMIEEKVNNHFKLARFKLFNSLINGGIEECCEVTDRNGVPYSSALNRGACINIGLDIINTLADHYRFSAPIFIDNAEAISDILPTEGQQIRLYVQANQSTLKALTA